MAGLRNNNNTQNAQWADYVGDILRGGSTDKPASTSAPLS